MILSKKQMTEEDVKLNFITPALLEKGWKDKKKILLSNMNF